MQAIRDDLLDVRKHHTTHAGLWWDKYLSKQNDQNHKNEQDATARAQHIKSLSSIQVPTGYTKAIERWRLGLELDPSTLLNRATADGRTIIGLGEKGALEAGLRLHHTWGVPYLPGSALKGVAAAAAHKLLEDPKWRKANAQPDSLHDFLFGTTDGSGAVNFLDALWLPEKLETLPIHLDVITVHHQSYYSGHGAAPSDTDNPIPVSFASVSGEFLVALSARPGVWKRDEQQEQVRWLEIAMEILKVGLAQLGIGAKTNAGYGRMTLEAIEISTAAKKKSRERLGQASPLQDLTASLEEGNWRVKLEAAEARIETLSLLAPELKKEAARLIRKEVTKNARSKDRLEALFGQLEA